MGDKGTVFVKISDVPMLSFLGKTSALFADGDSIGDVTPARDITVQSSNTNSFVWSSMLLE